MLDKIRTKDQYQQVMRLIETHLVAATNGGGFYSLSEIQQSELDHLSKLAADYEKQDMKLWPLTVSMPSLVEQKMRDLNLNQSKLAALFNMNVSKLSKILNGKMAPDISFLKAMHEKLGIDGNIILETI